MNTSTKTTLAELVLVLSLATAVMTSCDEANATDLVVSDEAYGTVTTMISKV